MGVDDGVGLKDPLLAVLMAHRDPPQAVGLVIDAGDHPGVEHRPFTDLVLVGHAHQVILHVVSLGVVVIPLRIDFEREGVEVTRRIDADARIAVLPPGAADLGILFDDNMVVAGLGEFDAGDDAGHAGADHQHLEPRRRLAPLGIGLSGRRDLEAHLLEQ